MAFEQWHARTVSRSRGRVACQAFGILVLLSLWATIGRPAASLPPSSHRRSPSEASRVERGTGGRQLPKPPPVERGSGNRQLPKPPPVERGAGNRQLPKPPLVERGAGNRQLPKPPLVEKGVRQRQLPSAPVVEQGVRQRQLPSPPPAGRGAPKEGELQALDSIAALIDGDGFSMRVVVDFLAELGQRGRVVERRCFAESWRLKNRKLKSNLESNSIDFIPVPRGTGPSRDAIIDAISGRVRELLQSRRIGAIALMVSGRDYVPLVEKIVGAGRRCFVTLECVSGPGAVRMFERAGAQILARSPLLEPPKYTCVLHSDGTGSIRAMSDASSLYVEELEQDEVNLIASQLGELGYRSSTRDPLLPSIAKFWFDNGLGDLIVFPVNCALMHMSKLRRERQHANWAFDRGDLALIFPWYSSVTKKEVRDYGSMSCARYGKAGIGPFIMRDSSTFVQEMLRKIGYVDDGLNACFQEGLDVFASRSDNARAMRKSGVQFSDLDTMREKEEKIRRLCLSASFSGTVEMPPPDVQLRNYFFANGLLKNEHAPADEMFSAMGAFVSSARLAPKKTYNGRIIQCLDVMGRKSDPSWRRPL